MSNPQDEREALVSRHMQLVTNFGNAQVRANPNTSTDKLRQKVEDSFRAALANQRAEGVPASQQPVAEPLCPECEGSGMVQAMTSHLGPDDYEYEAQCDVCNGTGSPLLLDQIAAMPYYHYTPIGRTVAIQVLRREDVLNLVEKHQAEPPSPQPPAAQATLTTERIAEIVRDHLDGIYCCTRVWEAWSVGTMSEDDFVPAAEIEMADEIAAALIAAGIGTAKPAQPEDENEVLRQKVKTLAREAWAWSKACEAESMKLTAVRKAIADAFLPMSRSGLWTKEHSQSYPSKAAEIINAARSIFDVEASQPAQPEGGITAPAGGGEGV